MKTLFVDVDETLLNYKWGFVRWMQYRHPDIKFEKNDYYPQDCVREFQNSILFSALPQIEGAVQAMDKIATLPIQVRVITASVTGKKQEYFRSDNLAKLFGISILEDAVYLKNGESKSSWMKKNYYHLGNRSKFLLIDDNPRYIKEFVRLGCRAIHLKGPFPDEDLGKTPSVSNWEEATKLIEEWANE